MQMDLGKGLVGNADERRCHIQKFPLPPLNSSVFLYVEPGETAILVKGEEKVRIFSPGSYELTLQDYPFLMGETGDAPPAVTEGAIYLVSDYENVVLSFMSYHFLRFDGRFASHNTDVRIRWRCEFSIANPEKVPMAMLNAMEGIRYEMTTENPFVHWLVRETENIFDYAWRRCDPAKSADVSLLSELNQIIRRELRYCLEEVGLRLVDIQGGFWPLFELMEELRLEMEAPSMAMKREPEAPPVAVNTVPNVPVQWEQPATSHSAGDSCRDSEEVVLEKPRNRGIDFGGLAQKLVFKKTDSRKNPGQKEEKLLPKEISKIQISALAPRKFIRGDYSMVHVVLYEEAFRHLVEELKEADFQEARTTAQVRENSQIQVRLTSPDLKIEDDLQAGQWCGDFLEFGFGVLLPEDYTKRTILFKAQVTIDGVPATRLTFTAKCTSFLAQKLRVIREDVLSAFVSYASEDREEVIRVIQGMRKARPDMDIFFDVETLRSGEDWEKALYREIECRDLLVLCWSRFAKASKWVDAEWRYALKQKGLESIDPIPLEPAEVCPPPEELGKKHFNDHLNYMSRSAFR